MSIDTQLQAYAAIKESRVAILTTKAKRALREHGALTTEEICDKTKEDYKSIQPRTSELHEALEIFDTGLRRHNESGKKAIVWKLVETEEEKKLAIKQTLKKMKPIGDEKLFGEMMRCIYALAASRKMEDKIKLEDAAWIWAIEISASISKSKFSADLPHGE